MKYTAKASVSYFFVIFIFLVMLIYLTFNFCN